MMTLSRRSFLTWSASLAAGAGLSACRSAGSGSRPAPDVPGTSPAATTSSVATSSATTSSAISSSAAPDTTAMTAPPSTASAAARSTAPVAPAVVALDDRVLVVVQLSGGNDGLNTLVPLTGRYHDLRPTIGLKDDALVRIPGTDGYGLHSSLEPLGKLLRSGRVATVASVGYANPSRSHFVALDNWWSATPNQPSATGWLGRYLDLSGGTADKPLRAIALGSGVPALQGGLSHPTVVLDPDSFSIKAPSSSRAALLNGWKKVGGPSAIAAITAVDLFGALAPRAASAGTDESEGGDITRLLGTAAELIVAGKDTKVIHISTTGFDTHAGQLVTHAALLNDLAVGIAHFFDRLDSAGLGDRALVLTTSEFGRRAQENGSGGTDHGKAGVHFLAGTGVVGGLIGSTDLTTLDDGDIKPAIDVRSLYRSALDWLGAPTREVLLGQFDDLGVLR